MAEPRRSEASVLLQVRGLNVYYGHSHALQGVDLTLDHGVLSVVGRNGMGKTTSAKRIGVSSALQAARSACVGRSSSAFHRRASPDTALATCHKDGGCGVR
jgi:ABC-type branched-subunit amino acid transport system ATPase component